MKPVNDLLNRRFGRLLVVAKGERKPSGQYWTAKCDCGNIKSVRAGHLIAGKILSCKCLARELTSINNSTHGYTRNGKPRPEFVCWRQMIQRCTDQNSCSYPRYGGRGISVCDRWRHSFQNFLEDMGHRPSLKHSLDRFPDNNGNYTPGNVRWATSREQTRNYSRNILVILNGESMCLVDAVEREGLTYWKVYQRMHRGWTFEEAIQTA